MATRIDQERINIMSKWPDGVTSTRVDQAQVEILVPRSAGVRVDQEYMILLKQLTPPRLDQESMFMLIPTIHPQLNQEFMVLMHQLPAPVVPSGRLIVFSSGD